jgi:hypothetical protein
MIFHLLDAKVTVQYLESELYSPPPFSVPKSTYSIQQVLKTLSSLAAVFPDASTYRLWIGTVLYFLQTRMKDDI